jgi:hypothetical protein
VNTAFLLIGIFGIASGSGMLLLAFRQIKTERHLSQISKILTQVIQVEVELLADKASKVGEK